jgi:hypothetical protein
MRKLQMDKLMLWPVRVLHGVHVDLTYVRAALGRYGTVVGQVTRLNFACRHIGPAPYTGRMQRLT